ncbi:AP2 domain transcription factor APVIIb-1/ADA2-B [Besnoitia besnoiti]|uniref:AP2 domain transcription factor APVIIb-1/ADA2-B n=1 Tax=Besnoitia besnoiti TaxID=94643 RepID=A0A2A9MPQ0_BESBE|nr:AP2 domain transcription factor APVIIb-1/ADA2-B [Besnoitia besnoiti]PFH37840.1 AP2 domain transcription factor APVIIb-1/ADA2-B [Besnoitia besnoiti]
MRTRAEREGKESRAEGDRRRGARDGSQRDRERVSGEEEENDALPESASGRKHAHEDGSDAGAEEEGQAGRRPGARATRKPRVAVRLDLRAVGDSEARERDDLSELVGAPGGARTHSPASNLPACGSRSEGSSCLFFSPTSSLSPPNGQPVRSASGSAASAEPPRGQAASPRGTRQSLLAASPPTASPCSEDARSPVPPLPSLAACAASERDRLSPLSQESPPSRALAPTTPGASSKAWFEPPKRQGGRGRGDEAERAASPCDEKAPALPAETPAAPSAFSSPPSLSAAAVNGSRGPSSRAAAHGRQNWARARPRENGRFVKRQGAEDASPSLACSSSPSSPLSASSPPPVSSSSCSPPVFGSLPSASSAAARGLRARMRTTGSRGGDGARRRRTLLSRAHAAAPDEEDSGAEDREEVEESERNRRAEGNPPRAPSRAGVVTRSSSIAASSAAAPAGNAPSSPMVLASTPAPAATAGASLSSMRRGERETLELSSSGSSRASRSALARSSSPVPPPARVSSLHSDAPEDEARAPHTRRGKHRGDGEDTEKPPRGDAEDARGETPTQGATRPVLSFSPSSPARKKQPEADNARLFGARWRINVQTGLKELDPELLGVDFHCNVCGRDVSVGQWRVRCAECDDFDLCLFCFARGRETGTHLNTHAYRPVPPNREEIFAPNWTADEEQMLLEGVSRFGLGNWNEVANLVNRVALRTKTKQQCEQHYMSVYIDSGGVPDSRGEPRSSAASPEAGGTAAESAPSSLVFSPALRRSDASARSDGETLAPRLEGAVAKAGCGGKDTEKGPQTNSTGGEGVTATPAATRAALGSTQGDTRGGGALAGLGALTRRAGGPGGEGVTVTSERRGAAAKESDSTRATDEIESEEELTLQELQEESTSWHPPWIAKPVPPQPHHNNIQGYLPLRGDFDVEHDNNAEALLADMAIEPQEPPADKALKLSVVEAYNCRLDERIYRKRTVLWRHWDDPKVANKERSLSLLERVYWQQLRPVQRFHNDSEHTALVRSLATYAEAMERCRLLKEWRSLDLRTLQHVMAYEAEKQRRSASQASGAWAALFPAASAATGGSSASLASPSLGAGGDGERAGLLRQSPRRRETGDARAMPSGAREAALRANGSPSPPPSDDLQSVSASPEGPRPRDRKTRLALGASPSPSTSEEGSEEATGDKDGSEHSVADRAENAGEATSRVRSHKKRDRNETDGDADAHKACSEPPEVELCNALRLPPLLFDLVLRALAAQAQVLPAVHRGVLRKKRKKVGTVGSLWDFDVRLDVEQKSGVSSGVEGPVGGSLAPSRVGAGAGERTASPFAPAFASATPGAAAGGPPRAAGVFAASDREPSEAAGASSQRVAAGDAERAASVAAQTLTGPASREFAGDTALAESGSLPLQQAGAVRRHESCSSPPSSASRAPLPGPRSAAAFNAAAAASRRGSPALWQGASAAARNAPAVPEPCSQAHPCAFFAAGASAPGVGALNAFGAAQVPSQLEFQRHLLQRQGAAAAGGSAYPQDRTSQVFSLSPQGYPSRPPSSLVTSSAPDALFPLASPAAPPTPSPFAFARAPTGRTPFAGAAAGEAQMPLSQTYLQFSRRGMAPQQAAFSPWTSGGNERLPPPGVSPHHLHSSPYLAQGGAALDVASSLSAYGAATLGPAGGSVARMGFYGTTRGPPPHMAGAAAYERYGSRGYGPYAGAGAFGPPTASPAAAGSAALQRLQHYQQQQNLVAQGERAGLGTSAGSYNMLSHAGAAVLSGSFPSAGALRAPGVEGGGLGFPGSSSSLPPHAGGEGGPYAQAPSPFFTGYGHPSSLSSSSLGGYGSAAGPGVPARHSAFSGLPLAAHQSGLPHAASSWLSGGGAHALSSQSGAAYPRGRDAAAADAESLIDGRGLVAASKRQETAVPAAARLFQRESHMGSCCPSTWASGAADIIQPSNGGDRDAAYTERLRESEAQTWSAGDEDGAGGGEVGAAPLPGNGGGPETDAECDVSGEEGRRGKKPEGVAREGAPATGESESSRASACAAARSSLPSSSAPTCEPGGAATGAEDGARRRSGEAREPPREYAQTLERESWKEFVLHRLLPRVRGIHYDSAAHQWVAHWPAPASTVPGSGPAGASGGVSGVPERVVSSGPGRQETRDGNTLSLAFSVKRLGFEGAWFKACEARRKEAERMQDLALVAEIRTAETSAPSIFAALQDELPSLPFSSSDLASVFAGVPSGGLNGGAARHSSEPCGLPTPFGLQKRGDGRGCEEKREPHSHSRLAADDAGNDGDLVEPRTIRGLRAGATVLMQDGEALTRTKGDSSVSLKQSDQPSRAAEETLRTRPDGLLPLRAAWPGHGGLSHGASDLRAHGKGLLEIGSGPYGASAAPGEAPAQQNPHSLLLPSAMCGSGARRCLQAGLDRQSGVPSPFHTHGVGDRPQGGPCLGPWGGRGGAPAVGVSLVGLRSLMPPHASLAPGALPAAEGQTGKALASAGGLLVHGDDGERRGTLLRAGMPSRHAGLTARDVLQAFSADGDFPVLLRKAEDTQGTLVNGSAPSASRSATALSPAPPPSGGGRVRGGLTCGPRGGGIPAHPQCEAGASGTGPGDRRPGGNSSAAVESAMEREGHSARSEPLLAWSDDDDGPSSRARTPASGGAAERDPRPSAQPHSPRHVGEGAGGRGDEASLAAAAGAQVFMPSRMNGTGTGEGDAQASSSSLRPPVSPSSWLDSTCGLQRPLLARRLEEGGRLEARAARTRSRSVPGGLTTRRATRRPRITCASRASPPIRREPDASEEGATRWCLRRLAPPGTRLQAAKER